MSSPDVAVSLPTRSALLPVESSAGTSRPLRAWNETDRGDIALAVAGVARQWSRQWGVDGEPFEAQVAGLACTAADGEEGSAEMDAIGWHGLGAGSLWWSLSSRIAPAPPRQLLLGALFQESSPAFPGPAGERIADRLADAAWLDWCEALAILFDCGGSQGDERASDGCIPPELLRPWRGTLLVRMPWCGARLGLVIDGDLIDSWFRKRATKPDPDDRVRMPDGAAKPLTPLLHAAGEQPVPLTVELEPFEIDLGSLATLRIGDVLCTTHSLEAGLSVRSDASAALCQGFLGRQGDRRVVELLRSAAAQ